jgi:hypothetical protein
MLDKPPAQIPVCLSLSLLVLTGMTTRSSFLVKPACHGAKTVQFSQPKRNIQRLSRYLSTSLCRGPVLSKGRHPFITSGRITGSLVV